MPSRTDSVKNKVEFPTDSLTHKFIKNGYSFKYDQDKFPVIVKPTSYGGYCLIAEKDLPMGTKVAVFEGPDVTYEECPLYDKLYVLQYLNPASNQWDWLLPLSDARYLNHSCEPNCIILGDYLDVICVKDVKEGEELTFLYNAGSEQDDWDAVWNFRCQCGSEQCQGDIDRYRPPRVNLDLPDHLKLKLKYNVESQRIQELA